MPFEPGKSGNPTGRPKEDRELKELARTYTREAVDRLVSWMKSENPKASVLAASILLDRGHGKAAQVLELKPHNPLEDMDTHELVELVSSLIAGSSAEGSGGGTSEGIELPQAGSVQTLQ